MNATMLDDLGKSATLEAAFFRPALRLARADASRWKSSAVCDVMESLVPLSLPDENSFSVRSRYGGASSGSSRGQQPHEERKENSENVEKGDNDDKNDDNGGFARFVDELVLASKEVRLAQASTSVVDLSYNLGGTGASSSNNNKNDTTNNTMMKTITNHSNRRELRTQHIHHHQRVERMNDASMVVRGCLARSMGLTDLSGIGGDGWLDHARSIGAEKQQISGLSDSSSSSSSRSRSELMGRIKLTGGSSSSTNRSKGGKKFPLGVNRGQVRQLLLAGF